MLRAGHGLILAVIALLTFGVVMVNSAGLSIDPQRTFELEDVFASRALWYALAALLLLAIASRIPVDGMYRLRGVHSPTLWVALASVALLLLVYVPMLGHEVNGALRWIKVGAFTFQPSELAKWGVLIVLAWHAARRAGGMGRLFTGFVPPMIFVSILCVLIAMEDLGTAVLIGAVCVMVLFAAGCRWWQVGALIPLGAAGFMAAVIHSPYRLARLQAYVNPYADPQGIGYHVIQSMASVAGGGLAGRGLGNSIQKFGYLPESTTDFIFAIICEELGVVGALAVVALYVLLLLCGLNIIRRVDHPFHKILGLGILLTISLQALINMAVVTGAIPAKGIALPLISSGGSGWLLTAFSLGLLVSMDRDLARKEQERALLEAEEEVDPRINDDESDDMTADCERSLPAAMIESVPNMSASVEAIEESKIEEELTERIAHARADLAQDDVGDDPDFREMDDALRRTEVNSDSKPIRDHATDFDHAEEVDVGDGDRDNVNEDVDADEEHGCARYPEIETMPVLDRQREADAQTNEPINGAQLTLWDRSDQPGRPPGGA